MVGGGVMVEVGMVLWWCHRGGIGLGGGNSDSKFLTMILNKTKKKVSDDDLRSSDGIVKGELGWERGGIGGGREKNHSSK